MTDFFVNLIKLWATRICLQNGFVTSLGIILGGQTVEGNIVGMHLTVLFQLTFLSQLAKEFFPVGANLRGSTEGSLESCPVVSMI